MESFTFSIPTLVKYGEGVSSDVGSEFASLVSEGQPKVMIVSDPGVASVGLLARPQASLENQGIKFFVYDEVGPNPRDTTVHKGAEDYHSNQANCIVAIGGGSVMDCAKAIGIIATYGGHISDFEGLDLVPGPIVPLIAIPSTAGTASEVTFWSIITNTETHVKMGIGDRKIAYSVALVDPVMTYSLPRTLTIGTGLDALTHAIEAYTCNVSNPASDALALKAIRLINTHLITAAEKADDEAARNGMMLGSLIAGLSFGNADCASIHCLSESIGGLYDAPHGILNGILLPYAMSYNVTVCPDRFADIAVAMGKDQDPNASVEAVKELNRKLDVPPLVEFNIREEDIHKLAKMSVNHGCNAANRRVMKEEDYVKLIEASLAEELPS